MGKEGKESSKNTYKGPMDKAKGGRIEGGRWGWVGQEKVVMGKGENHIQTLIKNGKK